MLCIKCNILNARKLTYIQEEMTKNNRLLRSYKLNRHSLVTAQYTRSITQEFDELRCTNVQIFFWQISSFDGFLISILLETFIANGIFYACVDFSP